MLVHRCLCHSFTVGTEDTEPSEMCSVPLVDLRTTTHQHSVTLRCANTEYGGQGGASGSIFHPFRDTTTPPGGKDMQVLL